MKAIFLIMIGLSSFSMSEETSQFIKMNGVVTDSQTTLEWQDDYSDNTNNVKVTKWTDAIEYCEGLSLNNKDDWRLPNKKELVTIVDYSKSTVPTIDSVFEHTNSGNYWSSTTKVEDFPRAWYVYFNTAKMGFGLKTGPISVRCVRGGE